ncbi:hypothetical protein PCANC_19057 [Puccinia coronata f. sp. avenae]|uniref:Uncharacterized protein n=1 Tax=Puccinia coronata f. sp. avenae TaxID=200324 RepID=A0A2N5V1U4_9BASI|nr:hypothetical protein PCANC_24861 [Puccinia coronata f. sp. avenae]PLW09170.1 hypothetical protein PCASD_23048 [Puccinia coronata f. sp. avenae]PLW35606.1 hypothetical protein PCANC_19057 [Puccinia coronata f. sp. avenae]PLW43970.1 hypothetical protein PCASD_06485 [Puccinia coronata f. sp. avenae]
MYQPATSLLFPLSLWLLATWVSPAAPPPIWDARTQTFWDATIGVSHHQGFTDPTKYATIYEDGYCLKWPCGEWIRYQYRHYQCQSCEAKNNVPFNMASHCPACGGPANGAKDALNKICKWRPGSSTD